MMTTRLPTLAGSLVAGVLLTAAGAAGQEPAVAEVRAAVVATPLPAGGVHLAFELPAPGRVSAAVYDAEGRLLRELARGETLVGGPHTLIWDGLDRAGQAQPPGDYEVRILQTPGFRAEYVTSLGTRPRSAPYDTWVGNHGGTAAVAVDETGLYAAATVTETAPVLLKQSLDGRQRHWTQGRGDVTRGRFQGGAALAADGAGRLYMLQQNGYLQVIDASQGRRLATWDVLPKDRQRNREESDQLYRHGETVAAADLAACGTAVVLSQRDLDLLTWLDPETGAALATLDLEQPGGIAVAPDGTVFAIAGERVLEVARGGVVRTVIGEGLEAPARLAYDPSGPHLLVVEWGQSQQIHRYGLDGGKQATFGRRGGRRDAWPVSTATAPCWTNGMAASRTTPGGRPIHASPRGSGSIPATG